MTTMTGLEPTRPVVEAETPILDVQGLSVSFRVGGVWTRIVDDVSFSIGRGESLGLVGESGSGKTMTVLAILGLAQSKGAKVDATSVSLAGRETKGLSERRWSDIRGCDIGMIFQQPTRSLNPAFTIG
ncbi:MAG: ATP-binding cassette domain-containing protein, partial [Acidimicrobiia bacterium]